MARLVLTMTMSLDGFFSGPDGELDWMTLAPDPEFSRDNVAFFDRIDRGFIGYPTASGMLPYWQNVTSDPQAPADRRALAGALNNLLPFLISRRKARRHPHRPDLRLPRARRRIRPHRAPRRARQRQARIQWQDRPGADRRQDLPVKSDTRTLPADPLTAAGAKKCPADLTAYATAYAEELVSLLDLGNRR
nr:hypothetical protein [Trebonia sp.]